MAESWRGLSCGSERENVKLISTEDRRPEETGSSDLGLCAR